MMDKPEQFAGGTLSGDGCGGEVSVDRLDSLSDDPKIAIGSSQVHDSSVPEVPAPGKSAYSGLPATTNCGTLRVATSSSPSTEKKKIVPRRRFQKGRVYQRGGKWVGSYRDYEPNPASGKRTRRTITFDESITSERAAYAALQPYLDDYNAKAKANVKASASPKTGKLSSLIEEWQEKIIPNRKASGARAALSHIRTYIVPFLGDTPLRELSLGVHQSFVTAVGLRTDRRKTVLNVYGTLSSILNKGRKWGYTIPDVKRQDPVWRSSGDEEAWD